MISVKQQTKNECDFISVKITVKIWAEMGRDVPSVHEAEVSCCLQFTPVSTASLAKWLRRPGFESRLHTEIFSGVESYQGLQNWHSSGYPARAPGFIGPALGLVGPVSVYCD